MNYSLITLGWKSLQNIKNVIQDAQASTQPPSEIIVVINHYDIEASKDILEYVSHEPAVTRWTYNSQNIGIGAAWNLGMHMAKSDVLVVVNDDCRVGVNTYERMASEFGKDPKVGAVGVLEGGKPHEDCRMTPQGFLIAYSKQMIVDIGGYLEFYNPLADERELCLRGWRYGWKSRVVQDTQWNHVHDISNHPEQQIPYLGDTVTANDINRELEPIVQQIRMDHNQAIRLNDTGRRDKIMALGVL